MKAYFSCGAGDFIAIESFLTYAEKKEISSFILVTRAAETIKKLIALHPIWRNLPVEIPMSPEEIMATGHYAFFDIEHLRRVTGSPWHDLGAASDYSGQIIYPQILSGGRNYQESIYAQTIEEIPNHTAIDPESHADDRLTDRGRNLTDVEILKASPREPGLSTLLSKLTHPLKESLGIVKGCRYFWGVDSMLAAYAARCGSIEKIFVKSINPIYYKWKPIYDPLSRIKAMKAFQ